LGAQSATAKFIEMICFASFAIFHVYLIQIYFESKYLKKLRFLDWNTEGFESTGFDIPLYASLLMTMLLSFVTTSYELRYKIIKINGHQEGLARLIEKSRWVKRRCVGGACP